MTALRRAGLIAWLAVVSAHPAAAQAVEPRLPVHEVASAVPGRRLAILLTGDGDWAALDRTIAETLAARGVSVVGLESRQWLSHGARKDAGGGRDDARGARSPSTGPNGSATACW
ncbi:MAG: AcvB/VirJ family lysyl-phosphatidylglycerol hydrolase [Gemmatimonadales bacterium]